MRNVNDVMKLLIDIKDRISEIESELKITPDNPFKLHWEYCNKNISVALSKNRSKKWSDEKVKLANKLLGLCKAEQRELETELRKLL